MFFCPFLKQGNKKNHGYKKVIKTFNFRNKQGGMCRMSIMVINRMSIENKWELVKCQLHFIANGWFAVK